MIGQLLGGFAGMALAIAVVIIIDTSPLVSFLIGLSFGLFGSMLGRMAWGWER